MKKTYMHCTGSMLALAALAACEAPASGPTRPAGDTPEPKYECQTFTNPQTGEELLNTRGEPLIFCEGRDGNPDISFP
tara:strand:+ start:9520 stop:9753 length:234 start_codon:yes stop_codon:yes gene_type:complete